MEEITLTKEQTTILFAEWVRRFKAAPEEFTAGIEDLDYPEKCQEYVFFLYSQMSN